MDELARAVLRRANGSTGRFVLGIDGPGGSGKSTIARELGAIVGGAVIEGDDFYLPSAQRPESGPPGYRFDLARLRDEVLRPAYDGYPVRYQKYDWDNDRMGDWVDVPDGTPIIVEGIYSTRGDLGEYYGYRIFVTADREVRLARGIARDGEDARSRWVDEWMPAEDAYIEGERPAYRADAVVETFAEARRTRAVTIFETGATA